MIFNLQRYSTHDGPGIRTVVFMKGCPLNCRWCQNPESRSTGREIMFDRRLCLADCELCISRCPDKIRRDADDSLNLLIDRSRLDETDYERLTECCPTQALTVCGEAFDLDGVMTQVMRDSAFYRRSGGGVTLSGGEPFMHYQSAQRLLSACKEHQLHTAVESCLHVPWRYIEPSLADVDLFLADLKHTDQAHFYRWTDGSVKRVMDNFRRLAAANKEIVVRVPLIPEFNADEASIRAIVDFAADEIGVKELHFLPYHILGKQKYSLLGEPYHAPLAPLNDPELLLFAAQYADSKGITAILRG